MMYALLARVICETFRSTWLLGKEESRKAFKVSFKTSLKAGEDGFRYFDLVLYGPSNYIQVWVRTRGEVIASCDLDEDGPLPGKDYRKEETPWVLVGDHDSTWRTAVQNQLRDHERDLVGLSGRTWFEYVEMSSLGLQP